MAAAAGGGGGGGKAGCTGTCVLDLCSKASIPAQWEINKSSHCHCIKRPSRNGSGRPGAMAAAAGQWQLPPCEKKPPPPPLEKSPTPGAADAIT